MTYVGGSHTQEQSPRHGELQDRSKHPSQSKGAVRAPLPGSEVEEAGVIWAQASPAAGKAGQALGGEPGCAGCAATKSLLVSIPDSYFLFVTLLCGAQYIQACKIRWYSENFQVWSQPYQFFLISTPAQLCSSCMSFLELVVPTTHKLFYYLTILKDSSLKSRCQLSYISSGGLVGGCVPWFSWDSIVSGILGLGLFLTRLPQTLSLQPFCL